MNPLFEVDAKSIATLIEEPFADVLNRLLRAEGSRIGLQATQIYTCLRTKEPDGGVDAAVNGCSKTDQWLPTGDSVWQFKSGDVGPAEIKKEFKKAPAVLEAVKQGATYVLCIGDDLTVQKKRGRERAVNECFAALSLPPKFAVLGAAEIAQWASGHPAICYLPQFSKPLDGDFMLWEAWAKLSRFRQEFQTDAQRSNISTTIREWLHSSTDVVHQRIEGLAGIGKSRLALEIFRPQHPNDGLYERVLYALSVIDIPKRLFSWISANPNVSLILVVDECSRDDMDKLEQHSQSCNGRLKLVTVGQSQEVRATSISRPDTFLLERLDDQIMRVLLATDYPSLSVEAVDFVVDKSTGFVKLAVALANAIVRHPEHASTAKLLRTQQVRDVISKLLVPDPLDLRALQTVAVLNRVGWDGDVALEGQAVAAFLQLNWQDAQSRVHRFVKEGFVAKQGRYRYVTPHLLAVSLVADFWDARGISAIELAAQLPTATSRRAFLERLHDLGDDPQAKQVTDALLVSPEAFPDLTWINEERSSIFALLAEINPQAGLRALQRLIDHLPRSELLVFGGGRRQIVFLLEKLAWLRQTFFGAARLLMKLADAENESWGNNASGVWVDLFGTYLGGTSVPALERHVLIEEALDSPSERLQLLATKAIARVFSLSETRSNYATNQGGRLVEPGWHPGNWDENRAVRTSGLALLDRAMAHESHEVREEATKILFRQAREIVNVGLADEVIERLKRQPLLDSDDRYEMRKTVDELLEYESEILSTDQKGRLSEFRTHVIGTSFAERLRRWTGRSTIVDWKQSRKPGGRTAEEQAADLADEVISSPEILRPELPYLATEARLAYPFAYRLGTLDQERIWWGEIEEFVRVGQGYAMASAYLQANSDAGRSEWRDAVLEQWIAAGSRELAMGVLEAAWRTPKPTNDDLKRIIILLERGLLETGRMGIFAMGGMTQHFSSEIFKRFVECVLNDDGEAATGSAIALLCQRLDFCAEEEESLSQFAWIALERHNTFASDSMTRHYADELAKRYQAHNPVRMTQDVLRKIETSDQYLSRSDDAIRLLEQATRLQPEAVWNVVSSWLDSKRPNRLRLYLALQGWYAQVVGAEVMLPWAEQHQPDGPALVATFCEVLGVPLHTLPRELLIRFGTDDKVASALYAQFMSGSYMGPTSGWYKDKFTTAQGWSADVSPAVQAWARPIMHDLEKRIEEWKQIEEEEL